MIKKLKVFFKRKIFYSFWKLLFLFKQEIKNENIYVIFADARGGSTWLMEILEHFLFANINWEPFDIQSIGEKKASWLKSNIKNNIKSTKTIKFIMFWSKMKRLSYWSTKYLSFRTLYKKENLLVKNVRSNYLIPFIQIHKIYKNKPILLLRHPIDIAYSNLRSFDNIYGLEILDEENQIKINSNLVTKTNIENKIYFWCKDNYRIIQNLNNFNNVLAIYYNDLLLSPEQTIQKILVEWKIDFEKSKLKKFDFRKSSSTASLGFNDLQNTISKQLNKNFEKTPIEVRDRINAIFSHFNIMIFNAHNYNIEMI